MSVMVDRTPEGDILPENILISDFGITLHSQFPINGVTRSVPGTYSYLAPELLSLGEQGVSASSDIWAVGCIGYELCIGKKLSENRETLDYHVHHGQWSGEYLDAL